MGDEKTEKVTFHSVFRQQKIQKKHIHGIGDDVVADAYFLLPQTFGHGVGDGVAVEHGNQQSVQPQPAPRFGVVVQGIAQPFGQQKFQTAEHDAVQHGGAQTPPHQIGDALFASCGGAPGELRDEQLGQPEQDTGGEHQNGEHHAADDAEGRKGAVNEGVQRQTLGDHQVFRGADAGFQYVSHGKGDGCLQKTAPYGDFRPRLYPFGKAQQHQAAQRQTGAEASAHDHALTGTSGVVSRPEGQHGHGHDHGAQLLCRLHRGQRPDAVGRGEIPRHDAAQAGDGKKRSKQPQGIHRAHVPDPVFGQRRREKIEGGGHGRAAQNAVHEAAG